MDITRRPLFPQPVKFLADLLADSKYPPAEPEALRLRAPQRGLFATGHGARECRYTDASDARPNGEEHTPGNVKL